MTFETSAAAAPSTDEKPVPPAARSGGATTWGRRLRSESGPVVLYVLIALGILWPYRSGAFRGAGDLGAVLAMAADARNALKEHQFPIRVAPHFEHGLRYPIYQFYGNFPYTVTGAIGLVLHADPYKCWKIAMLISLITAGYFTMRLALLLTRHRPGATLAGVIFMTAPYLWADINARGAFTETIAFDLLPVAFYFTFQCFRSARVIYVPLTAACWALVCLTHNITYLYGATFMALFLLPFFLAGGSRWPRLARLAGAGALHVLLILWYIVPQLKVLPLLTIHATTGNPYGASTLTRLPVLLAPMLTTTPASAGTPNLGLQIGWPILAAVVLAAGGLALCWRRAGGPLRLATAALLALVAVAFFVAWSPFDFWRHLPRLFWFVQFPYRVLMFVVLFGSLLSACALALLTPRGPRATWTIAILALVGLNTSSFVPRHGQFYPGFAKFIEREPGLDNIADYLVAPKAAALTSITDLSPELASWDARLKMTDRMSGGAGGLPTVAIASKRVRVHTAPKCEYTAARPVLLELPVLYYPGLLDVRDDGRPVAYVNAGRFLALPLGSGAHHLSVRFVGVAWANAVGWIGWGGVAAIMLVCMLAERKHWPARTPDPTALPSGGPDIATAATTGLSMRAVLAGFVAMVAFTAIGMAHPWRLIFDHSPKITATADNVADAEFSAQSAFDGDETTPWVTANSGPATLHAKFSRAAGLHGLVLDARSTSLYEGYSHVEVVLYYHGHEAYRHAFQFPDASHDAMQGVALPHVRADAMDLNFSDPVTERPDGSRVAADAVRPGYAEIRVQWDR